MPNINSDEVGQAIVEEDWVTRVHHYDLERQAIVEERLEMEARHTIQREILAQNYMGTNPPIPLVTPVITTSHWPFPVSTAVTPPPSAPPPTRTPVERYILKAEKRLLEHISTPAKLPPTLPNPETFFHRTTYSKQHFANKEAHTTRGLSARVWQRLVQEMRDAQPVLQTGWHKDFRRCGYHLGRAGLFFVSAADLESVNSDRKKHAEACHAARKAKDYETLCKADPRWLPKEFHQRIAATTLRFTGDEWMSPPWQNSFVQCEISKHPLHYPHLSKNFPGQIAYYPNAEYFRIDRVVTLRPGRYLAKYVPDLSQEEVRKIIHRIEADAKPKVLHVVANRTDSRDQAGLKKFYQWMYKFKVQASDSSCDSCMIGSSAVMAYGYKDSPTCAVYLTDNGEPDGTVIARAIGDIRKKALVRVYTNRDYISANTFEQVVIKAGFTLDRCSALEDILLVRDTDTDNCGLPYLDGQYTNTRKRDGYYGLVHCESEGDDDYDSDDYFDCGCCGDSTHNDDGTWIEDEEESVCRSCRNEHYVRAYVSVGRRKWMNNDRVETVGGTAYCRDNLEDFDIYTCCWNGEFYHLDNLVTVPGGNYCNDIRAISLDHPYTEDEDITHCMPGDERTLTDGTTCYRDDEEYYQAEIDEKGGEDENQEGLDEAENALLDQQAEEALKLAA